MNVLKVNGVVLPAPTKLDPSDYDITNSYRNANGKMIFDMVRADVHKLSCSWSELTGSELLVIRNAIKNKFNLTIEYMIPETNAKGTWQGYVGDRTHSLEMYINNNALYKSVQINFIEV